MQARRKRKLLAVLLTFCMLLSMVPVNAFASNAPAAPGNLSLEVTDCGMKASWSKPEPTGELDIFEYEVTLYKDGEQVAQNTVQNDTSYTFDVTAESTDGYGVKVRSRGGVSGTGDPDDLTTFQVTEWTDWSSEAEYSAFNTPSVASSAPAPASRAAENIPEGLEYDASGDGVAITGYTGSEGNLVIPETINGKTVTAIKESAFKGKSLTSVIIPSGVQSIGMGAFEKCEQLTSVILPNNMATIQYFVFRNCTNLTEITIPKSVIDIWNEAFSNCSSLSKITFASVEAPRIEDTAFDNCNPDIITVPCGATGYTSYPWMKDKLNMLQHAPVHHEAKAATWDEPGNIEYWYCQNCDQYSKNANMTEIITQKETIIKPLSAPDLYDLWVGDVQVTSANANDVLGDADEGATVSYDVSTNTLTLNNANITGAYDWYGYYGICCKGGLNLNLVGDSKVMPDDSVYNDKIKGMIVDGDLTVSGTGSLTVTGKDGGLSVYGDIMIESGTVNAIYDGADSFMDNSVYVENNLTVNGGSITGEGGTGIYVPSGTLTANSGTVKGKSTMSASSYSGNGIHVKSMNVNEGNVYGEGGTQGIWVTEQLSVNGGEVTGKCSAAEGSGIYVDTLQVTGGKITAEGGKSAEKGNGIYAGTLQVTGGTITADGGNAAIKAEKKFSTEEEAKAAKLIHLPDSYLPGEYKIYETSYKSYGSYYAAATIALKEANTSYDKYDKFFENAVENITLPATHKHIYDGDVPHKDPTCTENGVVGGKYCTICGDGMKAAEQVIPAGHDMKQMAAEIPATCTADGKTAVTKCSRCDYTEGGEVIPALGHNTDGIVAHKDATCTEAGVVGGTYCTRCNDGKEAAEAEISALGHNTDGTVAHKDATCTEAGIVGGTYCTRCEAGKADAEKTIPALGHDMKPYKDKVEPTCTTEGKTAVTKCLRCEHTEGGAVISALGHDMEQTHAEIPATCTAEGRTAVTKCSRCDYTEGGVTIPALGHNSEGVVEHKDATCTEAGVVGGTYCKRCGEGKAAAETVIPALGHNTAGNVAHKDATCTEAGVEGGTYCTRCNDGKSDAEKTIPALGHDMQPHEDKVEPTCTTEGKTAVTKCSRCDHTEGGEVIAKLPHNYGEWVDTNDGKNHVRTCKDCQTPEKAEHTFGKWIAAEDGKNHVRTCTDCGAQETAVHTFGEWTDAKDGKNHVKTCTACGTQETAAHTFGEWIDAKDGKNHIRTCSVCNAQEMEPHKWDEGTVTKEPTLWEKGEKTYTCTVCKAVKVEEIPTLIQLVTPTEDEAKQEQADLGTPDQEAKDVLESSVPTDLKAQVDEELKKAADENKEATVKIEVEIKNINDTKADEAQKAKIDKVKTVMEGKDAKLGSFFDINLLLKVESDGQEVQVGTLTETKEPLTFAITIQQDLQKQGREFTVVRIHDDQVEELPTTVKDGKAIFQTDKFSVYALSYKDPAPEQKPENNNTGSGNTENGSTGSENTGSGSANGENSGNADTNGESSGSGESSDSSTNGGNAESGSTNGDNTGDSGNAGNGSANGGNTGSTPNANTKAAVTSAATGDSTPVMLWVVLMLTSCGVVLGIMFYRWEKTAKKTTNRR